MLWDRVLTGYFYDNNTIFRMMSVLGGSRNKTMWHIREQITEYLMFMNICYVVQMCYYFNDKGLKI